MADVCTLDDVIKEVAEAIEKEKEAQVFYQKAADMVDKAEIKEFFLELKQDEVGHEMMLVRLKDDLGSGRLDAGKLQHPDPETLKDMGIARYLKKKGISPESGYQDAMITAMKREEEAWRGYLALADMTDCPEIKSVFKLMAQVEAGHLRRIEALYEKEVLEGY